MSRHHLIAGLLMTTVGLAACTAPSTPTPLAPAPSNDAVSSPADEQTRDGALAFGGSATGDMVAMPDLPAEHTSEYTSRAVTVPKYFVFAVSGGFNRNNGYGWAYGTNFQGVINTAIQTCKRYAGTMCEVNQYCTPPQLGPTHPWVAVARSSVFNRLPLDRGVTGFACGKTSQSAAVQLAVSQCQMHGCYNSISMPVR